MTRRKTPKNKTIMKEALKNMEPLLPPDNMDKFLEKYGDAALGIDPIVGSFVFPNDLDKIQPDQINGNLTIKFPEE